MPSSGARTLFFIESSPAERPSRLVHVTQIESSPAERPSRLTNLVALFPGTDPPAPAPWPGAPPTTRTRTIRPHQPIHDPHDPPTRPPSTPCRAQRPAATGAISATAQAARLCQCARTTRACPVPHLALLDQQLGRPSTGLDPPPSPAAFAHRCRTCRPEARAPAQHCARQQANDAPRPPPPRVTSRRWRRLSAHARLRRRRRRSGRTRSTTTRSRTRTSRPRSRSPGRPLAPA